MDGPNFLNENITVTKKGSLFWLVKEDTKTKLNNLVLNVKSSNIEVSELLCMLEPRKKILPTTTISEVFIMPDILHLFMFF